MRYLNLFRSFSKLGYLFLRYLFISCRNPAVKLPNFREFRSFLHENSWKNTVFLIVRYLNLILEYFYFGFNFVTSKRNPISILDSKIRNSWKMKHPRLTLSKLQCFNPREIGLPKKDYFKYYTIVEQSRWFSLQR